MATEIQTAGSGNFVAKGLLWLARTACLWLALMVGVAVSSQLVPAHVAPSPQDGPLSSMQALLVVNALTAIALGLLAARSRVGGWKLAVLVFIALFGMQCVMAVLDGLMFNNTLKMSPLEYLAWAARDAIVAAAAGVVAMLMFRSAPDSETRYPKRVVWRLAGLTFVYVVLYFAAGMWAWQHQALQTYYAHMQVSFGPLVAFQVFRGLLWALIALYVVSRLRGSLLSRAALMAVLFGVLTAAQLLYPNDVMPWDVRQVHLVEVGVSEMIYGILATFILLAGAPRRQTESLAAQTA